MEPFLATLDQSLAATPDFQLKSTVTWLVISSPKAIYVVSSFRCLKTELSRLHMICTVIAIPRRCGNLDSKFVRIGERMMVFVGINNGVPPGSPGIGFYVFSYAFGVTSSEEFCIWGIRSVRLERQSRHLVWNSCIHYIKTMKVGIKKIKSE